MGSKHNSTAQTPPARKCFIEFCYKNKRTLQKKRKKLWVQGFVVSINMAEMICSIDDGTAVIDVQLTCNVLSKDEQQALRKGKLQV
mmetsp:Transcript_15362/g.25057  ORF Transcript_15362/g.25057 Transcript_15362/m.25057 type:complete len:86 (-) Transcript_15362:1018-1275(-)